VGELLQRYYSIIPLLTVGVCAGLAGRATSHLVERALLSETVRPPPRAAATPPPPAKPPHGKDPAAILARNLFCSTCPPMVGKDGRPGVDDDAGKEIKSSLPYRLVATVTSGAPAANFAFVRTTAGLETHNARGQTRRVFPLSMVVPGQPFADERALVDHIDARRVYLKMDDHLEYLEIPGMSKRERGREPPAGADRSRGPNDLRRAVRRISDTRFEIDRSVFDSPLADATAVARAARVVPSRAPRDGRPNGLKLYAVRPDGLYAAVGLQNGDTLAAVNGQPLDDPAQAAALGTRLRSVTSLQLSVIRRGQQLTIDYSIR
jgi:hypothetical protein